MGYLKNFHYALMKYNVTMSMLYFHNQEKNPFILILMAYGYQWVRGGGLNWEFGIDIYNYYI